MPNLEIKTKKPPKENWEEEFETALDAGEKLGGGYERILIKHFISHLLAHLLAEQKEEIIEKIKEMKIKYDDDGPWFGQIEKVNGYNQALEDVLEKLNK